MTDKTIPPLTRLKDQARRMRARSDAKGDPMTQAEALEKLARMLGRRDWNTLRAEVAHTPDGAPVGVGDKVRLRYMGVPADGKVIAVAEAAAADGDGPLWSLEIALTAPVTIPSAEGMDLTRRRLRATVDKSGVTPARRSDGTPHLALLRGR
jgi:hypothetical protein